MISYDPVVDVSLPSLAVQGPANPQNRCPTCFSSSSPGDDEAGAVSLCRSSSERRHLLTPPPGVTASAWQESLVMPSSPDQLQVRRPRQQCRWRSRSASPPPMRAAGTEPWGWLTSRLHLVTSREQRVHFSHVLSFRPSLTLSLKYRLAEAGGWGRAMGGSDWPFPSL